MIGEIFSGQSKGRIIDEENSDKIDNDRETEWKRDEEKKRMAWIGVGAKAKIVTNSGRDPSFDSRPTEKIAFVAGSLWARNKIRFQQKSAWGLLPPDQILC